MKVPRMKKERIWWNLWKQKFPRRELDVMRNVGSVMRTEEFYCSKKRWNRRDMSTSWKWWWWRSVEVCRALAKGTLSPDPWCRQLTCLSLHRIEACTSAVVGSNTQASWDSWINGSTSVHSLNLRSPFVSEMTWSFILQKPPWNPHSPHSATSRTDMACRKRVTYAAVSADDL